MTTNKIQTGIRLPRTMYAKLKTLALADSRTVNNFVELILRTYVADYEREHGEIPETQD